MKFVANENDVLDVTEKGKVTIKGKGQTEIFAIAESTKNYNRCVSEVIKVTVSAKKAVAKTTKKATPRQIVLDKIRNFIAKALKYRKVKLKWKAVKGATGYQIAYSTKKKNFKIIKTVSKAGKTVLKSRKLKRSKTYYFAVRAYTKAKGKYIYGKYSVIKKVRIRR